MKTKLITRLINSDPALSGFSARNLPEAAKLRVLNCLISLERSFSHEELAEIEDWAASSGGFDAIVAGFRSGECRYYVCADESLYFESNGDSEVWAFASDFAEERILNGHDGSFDSMDADLLNYLGGYFAEAVEERGIR